MTSAIGGMLVNLEQQLLRSRPEAQQRFDRRDEMTTTAADGDGLLVIELPAANPDDEAPPAL
jgi:hypothetical protein